MANINDYLNLINRSKCEIKDALLDMNVEGLSNDFNEYPDKILKCDNTPRIDMLLSSGTLVENIPIVKDYKFEDWSYNPLPITSHWNSITYGNGKFVAISNGLKSTDTAYSEDGITWLKGTSISNNRTWNDLAYGNGVFVATSLVSSKDTSYSLTDGKKGGSWYGSEYFNAKQKDVTIEFDLGETINLNKFFIQFYAGTAGIELPENLNISIKEDENSDWVSIYNGEVSLNNFIFSIDDAVTSSYLKFDITASSHFIFMKEIEAYSADTGDNILLGKEYTHNVQYWNSTYSEFGYSEDGINWVTSEIANMLYRTSIAYGCDKFVIIGKYSNDIAYSENGKTWILTPCPINTDWRSITYGNGKFVVVGNSSYVLYSSDGINWTTSSIENSDWSDTAYGNGKFVAISKSSMCAYSEDGITWTTTSLPSVEEWHSITYGNGKFIAIASNSVCAHSNDGINWSQVNLNFDSDWKCINYGNGKFIALTNSGAYNLDANFNNILRSDETLILDSLCRNVKGYIKEYVNSFTIKGYDSYLLKDNCIAFTSPDNNVYLVICTKKHSFSIEHPNLPENVSYNKISYTSTDEDGIPGIHLLMFEGISNLVDIVLNMYTGIDAEITITYKD